MRKNSESVGSALPDPVHSQAAISQVPTPALSNKTAPGRTGPRGLSPRTTYSRVNTGSPPVPDAGMESQKNTSPRGMEFLPAKVAHEDSMNKTAMARPTLQSMVKAAMLGTIEKSHITDEAARQLATQNGESHEEKVASVDPDHYATEEIHKLAAALEYIEGYIKVADQGNIQKPGEGPGSIGVLEATSAEKNIDAGESGQAISKNIPKQDPPQQKDLVQVGNSGAAMKSNDQMSHGEQPVEPVSNQKASIQPANPLPTPTAQTKESAALFHNNLVRLGIRKEGSAPVELLRKLAEDALFPAKIEAGKQNPPDASSSEKGVPAQPSDVRSQAHSMVGSNQAAIDYKKREAKADPKGDVAQLLDQPPLTRRNDPVLQKTLDNANKAGVKFASISEDLNRVTAARALLSKMMDKVAEEKEIKKNNGDQKKEKESTGMGGAPSTPSSASGFTASSLG